MEYFAIMKLGRFFLKDYEIDYYILILYFV